MRTAAVTGGIGDIVYGIPIMRALGIGLLYIKENFYPDGSSMYSVMKRLLMSQGIDCLPTTGGLPFSIFDPKLEFDIDLDEWRVRPGRNRIHIIRNMAIHYGCPEVLKNWNASFLRNFNVKSAGYNLVFLSPRWRDNSKVNWLRVRDRFQLWDTDTFFIGLPEDHSLFCSNYGYIQHYKTPDIMDMAHAICRCRCLLTNQSVALTLAQGLGVPYFLEVKPNKTNTLFYTKNETIL